MILKKITLLFAFLFLLPANIFAYGSKENTIKDILEKGGSLYISGIKLDKENLIKFYHKNDYKNVWVEKKESGDENNVLGKNKITEELFLVFKNSYKEGLEPVDYRIFLSETFLETSGDLVKTDILITHFALKYITHLTSGRGKHPIIFFGNYNKELIKEVDKASILFDAINSDDFVEKITTNISPQNENYQRLKAKLAELLESSGDDFIKIPLTKPKESVHPGDKNYRVSMIRERLAEFGFFDMEEDQLPDNLNEYDDTLEESVKRFQIRNGLKDDAIIGRQTISFLNFSREKKISAIKANMERWRWMPKEFIGEKYIVLNIPDYSIKAFHNGEKIVEINAIVGSSEHRTPIMVTYMTQIVFNPYWYVPRRIALESLIPEMIKNRGYIDEFGFEFVKRNDNGRPWQVHNLSRRRLKKLDKENYNYLLRQKPSYLNSLGKVKFNIANNFSVYLHGTPDHSVFANSHRAFSSGCIRLEYPLDLVYFILEEEGWSRPRIRQMYYQNTREEDEEVTSRYVKIKKRIPVYSVYSTAWVDDKGKLNLRYDKYGYDFLVNTYRFVDDSFITWK